MKLLAISDLHLSHAENRAALPSVAAHPEDWLILAGDIGPDLAHLELALQVLTPRFARVIWTPGNHDLWSQPDDTQRGEARYLQLVDICRRFGALTPEDPYPVWPGDGETIIVPMFLLYDYSFRPPDVSREAAVDWARASGVLCTDERRLDPSPYPSRDAWCRARCAWTAARLDALAPETPTVLVNHWPLRYDLARPPRIPRFSIWSGTTATEDWARRYRARAVVSGHLHMRTTLVRDGVRFEEVSLGYPRHWQPERGVEWYLREILPAPSPDVHRFAPHRDPFQESLADARNAAGRARR